MRARRIDYRLPRSRMTAWLGNSGPNGRNGIHAALTGELAPVGFHRRREPSP